MNMYEMMLVLTPEFPVEDEKKRDGLIAKLLKGSSVVSVTVLGKKTLAYPIKKHTEGIYCLVIFSAEKLRVSTIEREMRLGTDVMRYLVTKKEDSR